MENTDVQERTPDNQEPRSEKKMKNRGQTTKSKLWLKRLVVVALIVAVPAGTIAYLLHRFERYLYGLDYYSPNRVIEEYFDAVKNKEYDKAMGMAGVVDTQFNTPEEFGSYCQQQYGTDLDHVVVGQESPSEQSGVFNFDVVVSHKKHVLQLRKTGKKGMGRFDIWEMAGADITYPYHVRVLAPSRAMVYLNGISLDERYRSQASQDEQGALSGKEGYSVLNDQNLAPHPEAVVYQVNQLFDPAEVTATDGSGTPCFVEAGQNQSYTVRLPVPQAQVENCKKITEAASKAYAAFITEDAALTDLTPYFYKDTEFYKELKSYYNVWYSTHEAFGYQNFHFFDMIQFDDTHMMCGISFQYYIQRKTKKDEFTCKYNVYLIQVNGQWLVSQIKNI